MYLRRVLAVNLAVMATTTALLLGMGQNNILLPLAALAAVVTSVWLTDLKRWFVLSHRVGNVAVLAAVFFTIFLIVKNSGEELAVSIANLLVFVQIVLLFQEKDSRNYWHIIILSAMQAVVAAAFLQGAFFAVVLVVYVFSAISTVALLFLHMERTYYQENHRTVRPTQLQIGFSMSRGDWRRLGKIALATLVMGPLSLVLRYDDGRGDTEATPEDATPTGTGRWPLGGMTPEFEGGVVRSGGRAGVGAELFWRMARITVVSIVLSGIVFMSFPRVGTLEIGGMLFREDEDPRTIQTVGFSESVELGELGDVLLDPDIVFRMRFTEIGTELEVPVMGDLYVRGSALVHYQRGRWSRPDLPPDELARRQERRNRNGWDGRPVEPPEQIPWFIESQFLGTIQPIRQRIELENTNSRTLFCIWPYSRADHPRSSGYVPDRGQLRIVNRQDRTFVLNTTGLVDGYQQEIVPNKDVGEVPLGDLLAYPRGELPTLESLARRWIEESGLPPDDKIGRAMHLSQMLQTPEEFTYTLDAQPQQEGVDPVENFIRNTHAGHCEYFASALALMLRSQGIPARVVVGFAVGEYFERTESYDPDGSIVVEPAFFQFRQYDAHAWVEAYLDPMDLPPRTVEQYGPLACVKGGWLRLDPTPTTDSDDSLATDVLNLFEWITYFWEDYVIGMDYETQRDAIYRPIAMTAQQLRDNLASEQWWQSLPRRLSVMLNQIRDGLLGGRWVSWRGGLAGSLICLVLYGLYRLLRRIVGRIVAAVRRHRQRLRWREAEVEFYRELEAVVARYGMKRPPQKTQREFAILAAPRIAQRSGDAELADLPHLVVKAFYQVRFGNEPLDKTQTQAVEQAIGRLRGALSRNGGSEK